MRVMVLSLNLCRSFRFIWGFSYEKTQKNLFNRNYQVQWRKRLIDGIKQRDWLIKALFKRKNGCWPLRHEYTPRVSYGPHSALNFPSFFKVRRIACLFSRIVISGFSFFRVYQINALLLVQELSLFASVSAHMFLLSLPTPSLSYLSLRNSFSFPYHSR